ncbi:adenylate/guanylate cyclase domain-containing protein [Leptolyngbyaceae cyanobacterium UHCC 1019]
MSQLSNNWVYSQALQSASQYAKAMQDARTFYSSEAVDRAKMVPGITVTSDYTSKTGAIPLPVTYLIELAHYISEKNSGMTVRLYSDYPFRQRQAEGGTRDEFERTALMRLRANPEQPYVRMEEFQGQMALRYAQADIMRPSCVACHNTQPDSPKRDWRVGDVRGVLEVVQPLDAFMAQTNRGLNSTFAMLLGLAVLGLLGIAVVIGRLRQTSKDLELRVMERTAQLQQMNQNLTQEQEKSERLLLNILPSPIAQRLKEGDNSIADGFSSVTILFADLVEFTQLSERISPAELVALLNEIFSAFDRLTEQYGLEKIKTIGDAYMVVGGLPQPRPDHAEGIAEMAIAMRAEIARFNFRHQQNCNLRIGINTGAVVAGVIGTKKFIYDLWGDAVNVASRMESHGVPGEIQVAETTFECLKHQYNFQRRGIIKIKGKGQITTYFLIGRKLESVLTP